MKNKFAKFVGIVFLLCLVFPVWSQSPSYTIDWDDEIYDDFDEDYFWAEDEFWSDDDWDEDWDDDDDFWDEDYYFDSNYDDDYDLDDYAFVDEVVETKAKSKVDLDSPEMQARIALFNSLLDPNGPRYMVDNANLLTKEELETLNEKLIEISERQNIDVAIVTTNDLFGYTEEEFADDFFDYNGYGKNKSRDGILFLLAMNDRKWASSTRGLGIRIFKDSDRKKIENKTINYYTEGKYNEGFNIFAEACDEHITAYHDSKVRKAWSLQRFLVTLIIGMLFGILIVNGMKAKLKSVALKTQASDYIDEESLKLTEKSDIFLFRTTTKTARPKSSGSSGSSTRTSSSGSTHGGSSGSF